MKMHKHFTSDHPEMRRESWDVKK